jgi:hypothetical protein
LLVEFEQTRAPAIKVTSPEPIPEVKPETANVTSSGSTAHPTTAAEIAPVAESRSSRPEVEKVHKPVEHPLTSDRLVFTPMFWLKWVGATVFVAVILNILVDNLYYGEIFKSVPVLFGTFAGLVGLMQWFLFQNELERWWIPANVAAGLFVGFLFHFLADAYGWWNNDILLTLFIIGNLVLGPILMSKAEEKSKKPTPIFPRKVSWTAASTGLNIFFILLSSSLLLFVLLIFSAVLSLTSAVDIFTVLFGIANVLVAISFLLRNDIPRNFGFIALAISFLLSGIMLELDFFTDNFQSSLFSIPAFLSLLSGIFFFSQEETRKDFSFIMLSVYLISLGVAYITVDGSAIDTTFSGIAAVSALLAAIFFFLRK